MQTVRVDYPPLPILDSYVSYFVRLSHTMQKVGSDFVAAQLTARLVVSPVSPVSPAMLSICALLISMEQGRLFSSDVCCAYEQRAVYSRNVGVLSSGHVWC